MIWRIAGIAAVVAVLALFVWAATGEEMLLPFLLAVPFIVIARLAWTRSRNAPMRRELP